jgi:pumilio family protein 6
MRSLLGRFLQKGVLSFAFVHHLLWEYTSYVHTQHDGEKMQDVVSTFSDSMLQLLSTKPGSKVVALIATYGTAKDRKKLVRLLKDKVLESTCHQ